VLNCLRPLKSESPPTMLSQFRRYPLTFRLTHIEKLQRLTAHPGGAPALYASAFRSGPRS